MPTLKQMLSKARATRRKPARRARKVLRRKPKSYKGGISNRHYATLTETVTLTDISANQTNYEVFQLNQFKRALSVAPNFKFYRAKYVMYKYEPIYNFFSEGGGGNETIPLAYMVMNRTQERFNYTAGQLQEQGAIPRKFTSALTMKYKPNWCSQGLGAYTQIPGNPITSINAQGLQKQFGWLACPTVNGAQDVTNPIISNTLTGINVNPMAVYSTNTIYNGHIAHFQQQTVGAVAELARRTVTVVWEFKGPKTYGISTGNNIDASLPDKVIDNNLVPNTNNNYGNVTIEV